MKSKVEIPSYLGSDDEWHQNLIESWLLDRPWRNPEWSNWKRAEKLDATLLELSCLACGFNPEKITDSSTVELFNYYHSKNTYPYKLAPIFLINLIHTKAKKDANSEVLLKPTRTISSIDYYSVYDFVNWLQAANYDCSNDLKEWSEIISPKKNKTNKTSSRVNQLHLLIEKIDKSLTSDNKPSAVDVWRELAKNYNEYDDDSIIQEITSNMIYWRSKRGVEQKLMLTSFNNCLSNIRKKYK